jgi:hypothetical protein
MLANRIKQQGDARCMIALALAYENIPSLRHRAKQHHKNNGRYKGRSANVWSHSTTLHQPINTLTSRIWQIISQTCALWTSRTILSKPMLCL